jgi:hypothetical protein
MAGEHPAAAYEAQVDVGPAMDACEQVIILGERVKGDGRLNE